MNKYFSHAELYALFTLTKTMYYYRSNLSYDLGFEPSQVHFGQCLSQQLEVLANGNGAVWSSEYDRQVMESAMDYPKETAIALLTIIGSIYGKKIESPRVVAISDLINKLVRAFTNQDQAAIIYFLGEIEGK